MKSLKQLREEISNHHEAIAGVPVGTPEDLTLLEGDETPVKGGDIPTFLTFRRIQYRTFPDNQTVALYYSKTVDKYLSIPFGPKGNLNVSEAKVYDSLEEAAPAIGALVAGAVSTGSKIAKAVGSSSTVKNIVSKFMSGNQSTNDTKPTTKTTAPLKKNPNSRFSSNEISKDKSDAVKKSKLQAGQLAAFNNTNKISDIREMVDKGIEFKTLMINERTVNINTGMAKRILALYDSVNNKNKQLIESMLNGDLDAFKKLLNFTIRN